MNERIQELALEAKLRPALLLYYYRTIHGLTDTEQEELEQIEKFALLIVQECIDNIKVWELDSRNHISYMLERHFGVEE